MGSLIRVGLNRLIPANPAKSLLLSRKNGISVRFITSKLVRSQDTDMPKKPDPWPYEDKSFTFLNYFFDKTTARFDENTKVIVVEGPIASGKSNFAKQLAEELDMLYFPEANLDMCYINKYGFDLRTLDDQLPEACRSFDINNFLICPKHYNTAAFQINQYQVKVSQYIDALAHLLSTGQGVVLDRSCYSDFVFTEAMYSSGYISKPAYKSYYDFRNNTIDELLRPHLVIYLDVPVKRVLENIKNRDWIIEKNSQVLTPKYLEVMEKMYKQKYLKEISKHAELLVYDWSCEGETEVIVEDIERINFNRFDKYDPRFSDWVFYNEEDWALARYKYADQKQRIMAYFNVPVYHVPELIWSAEDAHAHHTIINEAPGETYQPGYNASMGDKGILFRIKGRDRETLPRSERRNFC